MRKIFSNIADNGLVGAYKNVKNGIKSNEAIGKFLDDISIKNHMLDESIKLEMRMNNRLKRSKENIDFYKDSIDKGIDLKDAYIQEVSNYKSILGARKNMDKTTIEYLTGDMTLKNAYDTYSKTYDIDNDYALNLLGGDKPSAQEMQHNKIKGLAKSYLGIGEGNELDKSKKIARYGALGTGAFGAGVGFRYLSGGNMVSNSRGERDIVNVPFI
jgi:hypothetical protein